jgi:hypothetical protein
MDGPICGSTASQHSGMLMTDRVNAKPQKPHVLAALRRGIKLEAALRDNLKKRKEQARVRAATECRADEPSDT